MHLLALGAFWPVGGVDVQAIETDCPNAPFGARCFLTHDHDCSCKPEGRVLMHLLALGAF